MAFRTVACVAECTDARSCERRPQCRYARTFEPASAAPGPSGLKDWPRPFVFRTSHLDGRTIESQSAFYFDVHLFQLREPPVPEFVQAFTELGRMGLGPGRGRAELTRVEQLDLGGAVVEPAESPTMTPAQVELDATPEPVRRLRVQFVTPTELKEQDSVSRRPEFRVLMGRIRDRLSTLAALYGEGPLAMDFVGFGRRAAEVRLTACELTEVEATRRSSRTGQRHPIGGFVGYADYEGELAEFLPFLHAAQFSGVGRQTTWGKGELRLVPEVEAGEG